MTIKPSRDLYWVVAFLLMCGCIPSCSREKKGPSFIGFHKQETLQSFEQREQIKVRAERSPVSDSTILLCNTWFTILDSISSFDGVDDSSLSICTALVDSLLNHKCSDFFGTDNGRTTAYFSLTGKYGEICRKSTSSRGVIAFISYLKQQSASAEEQLGCSFESIFAVQPDIVLQQLSSDNGYRYDLLNHLAWGFVNNRYYGAKDPYGESTYKGMIRHSNPPHRELTLSNYRQIFFTVNPKLPELYSKHKDLIDYEFKQIEAMLTEE